MKTRNNQLQVSFKSRKFGVILLLTIITSVAAVKAQISAPGSPAFSLDVNELLKNVEELPYTPGKAQLKEARIINKDEPLKFAHQFTVNYTPDNSGTWTQLDNGTKVWRLLISSPNAYSINVIFDRYVLPPGAKLFIYNTDKSDIKGAFTDANNQPSGILATVPVRGDQVIVEYQEPAKVQFKAELMIGAVNHDFLGIHNLKSTTSFNSSGYCNVDVSCFDQDNNLDVRRAVVKIIIDGQELCTGTMINSAGSEAKPYLITSAHCYKLDASANTTLLYFNYDVPYCSDIIEAYPEHTLSGGEARVMVNELDIALVEMFNMPPAYYRPYFAGWTLNPEPTGLFKAIHHPWGDVKKIATFDGTIEASSFNSYFNRPYAQVDNFHWRVAQWSTGTTEPGSSGGPLFDGNNNFVGALSGGAATCSSPVNDYYWQFYKAWDQKTESNQQYKAWLDPLNSGVQSLNGANPYEQQAFVRLSNIEKGDRPANSTLIGGGYLSGHNGIKTTAYAERFDGIKKATIKGIYLMPGKSPQSSSQTFNISLWQGTNEPETMLVKKEDIALNSLRANREGYLEFDTPITVNGSFFVSYEINYNNTPIDTLAVYYAARTQKSNNTMLAYHQSTGWKYASELHENKNYSLWLDVLAEAVVYGDTQIIPDTRSEVVIYPVPTKGNTLFINSGGYFIQTVEVRDVLGRLWSVATVNQAGENLPIEIGVLPNGVYILKIRTKNNWLSKKFMVE
ncbi:Por secretion system C-terminal sorting domain-containing protein [Saccharicrinis carchari]|uniref:Por secretion system C-terminal sorting domain-containing protein n=1 Tax=Saccharicrinis carchari TaxID=1168039 RepID=A0A521EPQ8_SACCC|nr:T9SS type A sorting domain-containing protein [Saccharicrinis carchari]SMO85892.1 Por secretion system C-terminal sorting domain-containing protein [Saccharicrinis carchari]